MALDQRVVEVRRQVITLTHVDHDARTWIGCRNKDTTGRLRRLEEKTDNAFTHAANVKKCPRDALGIACGCGLHFNGRTILEPNIVEVLSLPPNIVSVNGLIERIERQSANRVILVEFDEEDVEAHRITRSYS